MRRVDTSPVPTLSHASVRAKLMKVALLTTAVALALSGLVRGLMTLHGGSVEAYSAGPGHGSVFTIRLARSIMWCKRRGRR